MRKSWWVFAVLGLGLIFYLHGMWKKEVVCKELEGRLKNLRQEKEAVMVEREDLDLQIESQNDPAYIEMVLMKQLGMTAEGQRKVYFHR